MKRYLKKFLKGACMMGIVLSMSLLFSMGNVFAADTVVPSESYPTLASAISAGKTSIVLNEDLTNNNQIFKFRSNTTVHINLNGHTLTNNRSEFRVGLDNFTLKISNGTVIASGYMFYINAHSRLELENVVIKGNGQTRLALLTDDPGSATIKLSGGEISGMNPIFDMNSSNQGAGYAFVLDDKNRTVFNNTKDVSNGKNAYINTGAAYINDNGKFVFRYANNAVSEGSENELPTNITLKKNETMKLNENGSCCRKQHIRYWSSDPRIATVSHCGKITARRPGKCKIYIKTGKELKVVKVKVKK